VGAAYLILWDIDFTLLIAGGVSQEAYQEAFAEATGRTAQGFVDWAGRTDRHIMRETLLLHEIEPEEEFLVRFADALVAALTRRVGLIRARGRLLPGAQAALAAFAATPGMLQSVLTGNLEPLALLKLTAFGLEKYVDLAVGGFGGDHAVRAELVACARRRAQARYGLTFDRRTTVVIGDTPHDIEAGLQGGAVPIGVATGRWSAAELAAAGARAVLPDLADTATVVCTVQGLLALDGG
jgi:phosphoglycolate phosphatase-like HAD superfamily hydrolase